MRGKGKNNGKLNNRGSALLTVLLFIAFLTILATTLLYISGMNFIIKQADYGNKKNFYKGETALETIKAELTAKVVAPAARDAYVKCCMNFVSADTGDADTTAQIRELNYNNYFTEAVRNYLSQEMTAACAGTFKWDTYFSHYVTGTGVTIKFGDADVECETGTTLPADQTGDVDDPTDDGTLLIDTLNGIVTIREITVTYVDDEADLTTIISTDLELHAPEIDWSVTQSLDNFGAVSEAEEQNKLRAKKDVEVSRCVIYTNWVKQ